MHLNISYSSFSHFCSSILLPSILYLLSFFAGRFIFLIPLLTVTSYIVSLSLSLFFLLLSFFPSLSVSFLHSAVLCGSWRHSAVLWSQWGWGMFGQCCSPAGQRSASGSGRVRENVCVRVNQGRRKHMPAPEETVITHQEPHRTTHTLLSLLYLLSVSQFNNLIRQQSMNR